MTTETKQNMNSGSEIGFEVELDKQPDKVDLSTPTEKITETQEVEEVKAETKETKEVKEVVAEPAEKEIKSKAEKSEAKETKTSLKVPVATLQRERQLKQEAVKNATTWKEKAEKAEQRLNNIKLNASVAGDEVDDSELTITDEDIQELRDEGDVIGVKKALILQQQQQSNKQETVKPEQSQDEIIIAAVEDSGLADYYAAKDDNGNDIVKDGITQTSNVYKKVVELDKKNPIIENELIKDRFSRILKTVLDGATEPQDDLSVPVSTPQNDPDVFDKIQKNNFDFSKLSQNESAEVLEELMNN